MNISVFIKRHPVLTYFILTFAISWSGFILVVGGPSGFPGVPEQFETLLPFVAWAMLAGPSVAGILLISLIYGRAGFRELLSRLLRWRVGVRWYAVALLPAPLLAVAVLFALSQTSMIFTTDDKAGLVLSGIAAGLTTVFEEIGWTGFAVPRLRRRYSILTTGLIVGIVWGAWHFLQGLWISGTYSGALPLAFFLPPECLVCRSATYGLQGALGVGLRPYREPARGDAHARESYSQHGFHLQASGDRGVLLDLCLGIGRRAVGRRRSAWKI